MLTNGKHQLILTCTMITSIIIHQSKWLSLRTPLKRLGKEVVGVKWGFS